MFQKELDGYIQPIEMIILSVNLGNVMTPQWERSWRIIYRRIPAQRIGNFEIVKDNGYIALVSYGENNTTWMTNSFDEWRLYRRLRKAANGVVLLAGLGLGFDALRIARKDNVSQIIIVEKSEEVINLVWPYLPHRKMTLINADIKDYLQTTQKKFNIIYFDIFPGGCESFPVATRNIIGLAMPKLKVNGHVICFRETLVTDNSWDGSRDNGSMRIRREVAK